MIIGFDPGKSGGIAALDANSGAYIDGIRTPILKHGKRDVVDTAAINDFIRRVSSDDISDIVIEAVHAMPAQGVTSMFNFGRHTGSIEGWAVATGKPVVWVTPQKWKKHFGLSRDKRASLDRARLDFGAERLWEVLANDGIAEAALIARWFYLTQT